jgi:uncharacterized membrane protein
MTTTFRTALCAAALGALLVGAAPARAQYRFETLTPPDMPAGDSSGAEGINNAGQVVIATWNPATGYDGFYLYDHGMRTYTRLPQDPDAVTGINTQYFGLNNLGQFVGVEQSTTHTIPAWAAKVGWTPLQSFMYSRPRGTFDNFMPTTPGAYVSEATSINDEGVIVGVNNTGSGDQGYILHQGVFKPIDVLPTGTITGTAYPTGPTTDPMSINNSGIVVGYFSDPSSSMQQQGFWFDSRTDTFFRFDCHGNLVTEAYGINDNGEIVGYTSNDPTGATGDGFTLVNGRFAILDYPGAVVTSPSGIDISGLIVGEFEDSMGNWHAYLATPVRNARTPIPSDPR